MIYGLTHIPTIAPWKNDDSDNYGFGPYSVQNEVSSRNYETMEREMKTIKPKTIMEIGLNPANQQGLTWAILRNKLPEAIYLGVDIEDRSGINNKANNVYTLHSDSAKQEVVRAKLKELGVEKIDLLFIDGWHSVNMVVNDWKYVDMLSDIGIVAIHDTNIHPGPVALLPAIDTNLFTVERLFVDCMDDYGLTIVRRAKI